MRHIKSMLQTKCLHYQLLIFMNSLDGDTQPTRPTGRWYIIINNIPTILLTWTFLGHKGKASIMNYRMEFLHEYSNGTDNDQAIVAFSIPVSPLKVFDHSIHSERTKIYLGKSIQTLQKKALSYHDYSVSATTSQLCSGKTLKKLFLFSSILVHYLDPRQSVIKVAESIQNSELYSSPTIIQAQTFSWPNPVFSCSVGYIDAPNKGIEQACFQASCDNRISSFSLNLYFGLK